jgi:DNA repair protein SbcD/Mre11
MKVLHTADWHVGKVLKGRSRQDEHEAALASIVTTAKEEDVDLVLVAGDVFDSSAPSTDAQSLVMRTVLALNEDGRGVVIEGGNHDNPRQLDVFRPLLGALGVTVVGRPRRADDGGRVDLTTRSGEKVRLGILPFVSKRYAVSAAEVMANTAAENNREYADLVGRMVASLTDGFDKPGAVNLLMTHATLSGATTGGGERESQIFDYYIHAGAFPSTTHYVALGHLHRRQAVPGPAPIHYCGSPLQIDFGETENQPVAVIIDVEADAPARTKDVVVHGGRSLRTLRGTLSDLMNMQIDGHDWLRVVVCEKPRAGLSEEVREQFSGALEVRIDPEYLATRPATKEGRTLGKSPMQLFDDYLATQRRGDAEKLIERFGRLLDEAQSTSAGAEA